MVEKRVVRKDPQISRPLDRQPRDLSKAEIEAALKGLTSTDGYAVLKLVADAMALNIQGQMPLSPVAFFRFLTGSIMRRGYEMLWSHVEKLAQTSRKLNEIEKLMLMQGQTRVTERETLIDP